MSFRKRNVPVTGASRTGEAPSPGDGSKAKLAGVRPSSLDGRLVTSTGTASLDNLLGGHGGLALGTSLLIEENGTTDYAGALLKLFAAEGLLQGHHVHVLGLPEPWGRELPGIVSGSEKKDKIEEPGEQMKIAWRYESLGHFGTSTSSRGSSWFRFSPTDLITDNQRTQQSVASEATNTTADSVPFNHTFDLTKRLVHPPSSQLSFYQINPEPSQSTFATVVKTITSTITNSPPQTLHRLILPSLLSPALYPPHASNPSHLLPFLQRLRSLLSTQRMTILTSLPLSLHARTSGLTRFIELLHDGVLELLPFLHSSALTAPPSSNSSGDEVPQGLLRIHKLPVLHERGSGIAGYEEDWTFSLSRRTLKIKPYNLPPVDGDQDGQENVKGDGKGTGTKDNLEF